MSRSRIPWNPATAAFAVSLVVLGLLGALSTTEAGRAPEGAPDDVQISLHGSGYVVSIDPATGRIRPPTRDDARSLARYYLSGNDRDVAPLRTLQLGNGLEAIELPEEYDEFLIARLGPYDLPLYECVSGIGAAMDRLQNDVPFLLSPIDLFLNPPPVSPSLGAASPAGCAATTPAAPATPVPAEKE